MQLSMYHEPKSFYQVARERVNYYGEQYSELSDLICLIIGNKAKPEICNLLSAMSIKELYNLSLEELIELGLTKQVSERFLAAILFAKKLNSMTMPDVDCIGSPEDAYHAVKYLTNEDQETFVVLALNTKNKIISRKEIFRGSVNASIVHPREVFRYALNKGAASIIVAHQHPSGNPSPSREDIDVTKRLRQVGEEIGIPLIDHIIVGKNKFYSMKEKGYL